MHYHVIYKRMHFHVSISKHGNCCLFSLCINQYSNITAKSNEESKYSFLTPDIQFSSVQSLSHVQLFATPWIVACQASLSITNSRSSLRLKSIKSVMPSSHLILCRPLLLLPPIPPSIRVFSIESTLLCLVSHKEQGSVVIYQIPVPSWLLSTWLPGRWLERTDDSMQTHHYYQ